MASFFFNNSSPFGGSGSRASNPYQAYSTSTPLGNNWMQRWASGLGAPVATNPPTIPGVPGSTAPGSPPLGSNPPPAPTPPAPQPPAPTGWQIPNMTGNPLFSSPLYQPNSNYGSQAPQPAPTPTAAPPAPSTPPPPPAPSGDPGKIPAAAYHVSGITHLPPEYYIGYSDQELMDYAQKVSKKMNWSTVPTPEHTVFNPVAMHPAGQIGNGPFARANTGMWMPGLPRKAPPAPPPAPDLPPSPINQHTLEMRSMLGRDPTAGELNLSFFQGSNFAYQMLQALMQNPAQDARSSGLFSQEMMDEFGTMITGTLDQTYNNILDYLNDYFGINIGGGSPTSRTYGGG